MSRSKQIIRTSGTTAAFLLAGLLVVLAAHPATSQPRAGSELALPSDPVVIDIDAPEEQVFRVGIPDVLGGPPAAVREASDILRNDFRIMPGYRVIGPESIQHDVVAEGLDVQLTPWALLGANGIIKAQARAAGNEIEIRLRFYAMANGNTPALSRVYKGPAAQIRPWMHDFGNEVLRVVTGERGPFGTKLAFARKAGLGQKDVYVVDMDGYGERRVSSGVGVSMLPSIGGGNVWFTRMTRGGTFVTHARAGERPVVGGPGLQMGPAVCGDRIYFTSTRDGNSEIYSAALDGSNARRLTNHPALDLSPACGPGNKLAFVSERHGGPQIFTMNRDGSSVQRVTFRGNHNQTPSWCMDSKKPLIAFSGRDTGFDVFTVNIETQIYTRITQGQGEDKDPTFSPDCRVVAFASTRRGAPGIYLAGPDGHDQVRVVEGRAETVRWSP